MSPPIARRESDEDESEAWRQRRWRGIDQEEFGAEQVGVKIPGGWGAWASGAQTPLVLLFAIILGVSLALGWIAYRDTAAQHATITSNQVSLVSVIKVQNWLISLPPGQRPRLSKPVEAEQFIERRD